jgi:hypothetical protein
MINRLTINALGMSDIFTNDMRDKVPLGRSAYRPNGLALVGERKRRDHADADGEQRSESRNRGRSQKAPPR